MIKAIKSIFNNWIYPIVFFCGTLILLIISGFENSRSHYLLNTAGILLCIGILTLSLSSIIQFFKKKWKEGFISIVILFGGIVVLILHFFIISTIIPMIAGDKWADNLEIPKNTAFDNPIDLTYIIPIDDSIRNIKKNTPDLQIYNSIQKGIYQYDFWFGRIERGIIYLKAFEVTEDIALSVNSLQEKSEIAVFNPSDSIRKFGSTKDFTIYEGDWGKPYVARFEVWYKSETGGQERKIFQKNFKIEGWMH